jgi:CubicO group peptidase (beta-lactamase class C family)
VFTCVIENGEAIGERANAVVPWWSYGKTVLAAAALALVEQGRLSLDAPISGAPYTLRQLLQHRAGLRDYGELADYHRAVAAGDPPWTAQEMLARAEILPRAAPGAAWAYSNIGYLRVRELIEHAFGGPPGAALEALVFEPLSVADVRLATRADDLSGVEMGRAYDPAWVYHGLLVGPLSSAAKVLDGLLAGRLLTPETLAAMRDGWPLPQFAGPVFAKPAYGLGLMVPETKAGWTMAGHSGGGPGSSVAIYAFEHRPVRRTVAVFAASEDQGAAELAAFELGRT